jgi:regulator of nonsense transcripts 3
VGELFDKVRGASFQDARTTYLDPVLGAPPSVEYAPYARVPGSRARKDGRQGTIDQDPEFIAFLESLTNPVVKSLADGPTDGEKQEKITTTPLIRFIKEKKANKGKEVSSPSKPPKHSRTESKEPKAEKAQAKKVLRRAEKDVPPPVDKQAKLDKATKDAVKAANKQLSNQISKIAGKPSTTGSPKDISVPASPAPERKRERGNLTVATKILRRDLGLAPATPTRRRTAKSAGNADTTTSKIEPVNELASELASPAEENAKRPPTPKGPKAADATQKNTAVKPAKPDPPTEPAAARNAAKSVNAPSTPATKSSTPSKPKQAISQSTATQAFLKHANPSQGVTEALLEAGFATFGTIIKVEIDKKKGFGYVDFAEPEGLQRAIQASPVQIAQSQVVVLERKSVSAVAQARGNNNRNTQPPSGPAGRAAAGIGGTGPTQRPTPPQRPRGGRGGRNKGSFAKGGDRGGGVEKANSSSQTVKVSSDIVPPKAESPQ